MNIIILGAGMSGLSAAIRAARKGHEVTVIERQKTPGGKLWQHKEGGFTFDMGPSMMIETDIINEVLDTPIPFEKVSPTCTLVYDDEKPIVLGDNYLEVLQQEAPQDLERFLKLKKRMQPVIKAVRQSLFQKPFVKPLDFFRVSLLRIAFTINPNTSAGAFAQKYFESPLLQGLFSTFPSYTEHPVNKSPAVSIFVPFIMLEGIYYPRGGIYRIATAYEAHAKKLGVTFKYDETVTAISQTSVVTGKGTYAADAIISTIDYTTTQALRGSAEQKTAAHAYFAVAVGLNRTLPEYSHHTFLIPKSYNEAHALIDEGKLPDEVPLYLCIASKTDPECAPKGKENVFVVAVLPSTQEIDWKAEKEPVADRLLKQAGISPEMVEVRRVLAPDEFDSKFMNLGGSVFGASGVHNPFVGFRQPNADGKQENLFYAGATVQPGSGVPLVIRSGKFAVDMMERYFAKRKELSINNFPPFAKGG
ncbi:NAD(P)/FAD-dependent oxidoreductase [Thiorhodococcus mannitoliphagus]|uniref:NAD(P)/FAD-dependent oxidoreductase n=1 Tax=Thiorhodococcus mannitoliphagus TaxID=329406 RepID=A0A6P1DQW6_9GAMM|nr:NAD(P)/FAD-dependent oxidoreductase [Thiorhodococcus mannitoliphagus]NEX19930.1 NAD(P)/FAD-dependent oxidoreductase [Thiorhodococcus mannitoliphagus]